MSTGGAVLHPAGTVSAAPRVQPGLEGRLGIRVVTFAALAAYGILRWATLLSPAPGWRLLGLAGTAIALVVAGRISSRWGRWPLFVLTVVAVVVTLGLCGIPWSWLRHVRIAVTLSALGSGLSALPQALVPYLGVNEWLRVVVLGGAGVLLLDGAVMVAAAPREEGDLRRAASGLPLVALAVVPMTLVHPQLLYIQGLVLFALIAAFMWGDRIARDDALVAGAVVAVAAAGAMVAAPGVREQKPWINYQGLASTLAIKHPESFDWSQRYGPLLWPRRGRTVLEVQASRPDYWKAEDLDGFDGFGWVSASVPATDPTPTIAPVMRRRWTQVLHVTLDAMSTANVIAAGTASPPAHLSDVTSGASPGTWQDSGGLGPGASYTVSVYDPQPSAAELERAGTAIPEQLLPAYLSAYLPVSPAAPNSLGLGRAVQNVTFAPFGQSVASAYGPGAVTPAQALAGTAYGPVFALARRLSRAASTPYAYAARVERYLGHGFTYTENPRPSRLPIVDFLLRTRRGYCQQFAGAMALLLRMGGVPARVAVGFTTGSLDHATHSYLVSDLDAHAWVEAWFPHIGWVRFDPTPAAAPARGGHVHSFTTAPKVSSSRSGSQNARGLGARNAAEAPSHRRGSRAGSSDGLIALLAAAVLVCLLLLVACVRMRAPSEEQILRELERALARMGRPVSPQTTLAALEARFAHSPAATYLRELRIARFAPTGGGLAAPRAAGRRALRRALRTGHGPLGAVRALWALPPRIILRRHAEAPRAVSTASGRGIH